MNVILTTADRAAHRHLIFLLVKLSYWLGTNGKLKYRHNNLQFLR